MILRMFTYELDDGTVTINLPPSASAACAKCTARIGWRSMCSITSNATTTSYFRPVGVSTLLRSSQLRFAAARCCTAVHVQGRARSRRRGSGDLVLCVDRPAACDSKHGHSTLKLADDEVHLDDAERSPEEVCHVAHTHRGRVPSSLSRRAGHRAARSRSTSACGPACSFAQTATS